jgi:hypothetical protein
MKAQNLETLLKLIHIPYILAYHLQIIADPDPDPTFQFNADPCGSGSATLPMRVSGSLDLKPHLEHYTPPPTLVNGMPV